MNRSLANESNPIHGTDAPLSPTLHHAPEDATRGSAESPSTRPLQSDASVAERMCELVTEGLPTWNLGATYRLQFHKAGVRFEQAKELTAYLRQLGVTHMYSSPLLKAQSGSTHGYDVVDPTRPNDELGSGEVFERLITALRDQGLGHLLDVVPNHMSVAGDQNQWWMDVLKHGPSSRYAMYFDIDWRPTKSELRGRVLLPVLGAVSGEELEAGRLAVRYTQGEFFIECNNYRLPLDPKTCVDLLAEGIESLTSSGLAAEDSDILELQSIVTALEHLPDRNAGTEEAIATRQRESQVIQRRLTQLVQSSMRVAEHLAHNLWVINGEVGKPETFNRLDQLLERQAYRLVHWRASSDEINYRRFFDVTSLAALSIERRHVFETTHRLILDWLANGKVSALRIDHVDGLFDPTQYLWRLQWCYLREVGRQHWNQLVERGEVTGEWGDVESQFLNRLHARLGGVNPQELFHDGDLTRPPEPLADSGSPRVPMHAVASGQCSQWPLPVYVEKILGADEPLPPAWPVLGTTGYDFLNVLNGVFIHPHGFKQLLKHYERFVLRQDRFEDVVYECKRLILSGPMHSEVTLLASRLDRLAHRSRYWRDFTLNALEFALQEIIACFSVYRTYIRADEVSPRDAQVVQRAVAMAKRRNPAVETTAFDFVRDVLLLNEPRDLSDEAWRDREYLVGRFQQVTSPVQAKGVEDTAFYRYVPLLSIDEVGGEPRHALKSVDEFHNQNAQRQETWPLSMLTTTTHDTKRTEDVRARLNVLSEVPGAWRKALQRWHRLNRKHIREVDGEEAPSKNDQWLFYQTLAGMWPGNAPTDTEREDLIARLQQYMEKATHEAKLRTSWISPNAAYDSAVKEFVRAVLKDSNSKFAADLQEYVDGVLDAGLINAASQVALKLTAPGVPDIYQGQELWDFSLVDPDNRRPVDFDLRRHLLGELQFETRDAEHRLQFARYLSQNVRDNRLKLWVTVEGLAFHHWLRSQSAALRYRALEVEGPLKEHAIACAYQAGGAGDHDPESGPRAEFAGIVIVPRFVQLLGKPLREVNWRDTVVRLPVDQPYRFEHVFSSVALEVRNGALPLADVFADFPIGMLKRLRT